MDLSFPLGESRLDNPTFSVITKVGSPKFPFPEVLGAAFQGGAVRRTTPSLVLSASQIRTSLLTAKVLPAMMISPPETRENLSGW